MFHSFRLSFHFEYIISSLLAFIPICFFSFFSSYIHQSNVDVGLGGETTVSFFFHHMLRTSHSLTLTRTCLHLILSSHAVSLVGGHSSRRTVVVGRSRGTSVATPAHVHACRAGQHEGRLGLCERRAPRLATALLA